MSATRIERDCLGEMEIPEEHYYGIQTHRMVKVSGTAHLPVIFYPGMHRALAQIKKACARANAEIGAITPEIGKAIAQAADEVYAGKFDDQFPLAHQLLKALRPGIGLREFSHQALGGTSPK